MSNPSTTEDFIARPDPRFKLHTSQLATRVGLKVIGAELPQILSADLILEIPQGTQNRLQNTLFEFLQDFHYVVIDFKSQADTLDIAKFLVNIARTALFCSKLEVIEPPRILNLIVSSRYPHDIISLANPKTGVAQLQRLADAAWLWRGSYFFQEIAIVVCRDLPVEPKYYEWLIFAPANSENWKRLVRALLTDNRQDLIDELIALRPKEFKAVITNYLKELDPVDQEWINKEISEFVGGELERYLEESPTAFQIAISRINPDKLAAALIDHLNPDKLAAALIDHLNPDKLAAVLTSEQKAALRKILEENPSDSK